MRVLDRGLVRRKRDSVCEFDACGAVVALVESWRVPRVYVDPVNVNPAIVMPRDINK